MQCNAYVPLQMTKLCIYPLQASVNKSSTKICCSAINVLEEAGLAFTQLSEDTLDTILENLTANATRHLDLSCNYMRGLPTVTLMPYLQLTNVYLSNIWRRPEEMEEVHKINFPPI